jgi:hypothetical protein
MRYLVVAHQTATSPELRKHVALILKYNQKAEFGVLVPATPVGLHLTWDEDQTREASLRRADEARAMIEEAGGAVVRTAIGSRDPLGAIGDELREHPEFDAIIVCTLPVGVSRWLRQDLPHRARRFGLPVTHIVAEQHVAAPA